MMELKLGWSRLSWQEMVAEATQCSLERGDGNQVAEATEIGWSRGVSRG